MMSLHMPAALPINWDAIRIEFAHGMTIPCIAAKYNVSEGTLKARSAREKWIEMRPETHATEAAARATVVQGGVLEGAKEAAKQVAQSWAERGEKYRTMMFDKTSSLMQQATLSPPKNWKDAEIVDKMARRAAGLDNLETQVNTIIGIGSLEDGPMMADFEGESVHKVSLLSESTE
jgi:hypothetical protein